MTIKMIKEMYKRYRVSGAERRGWETGAPDWNSQGSQRVQRREADSADKMQNSGGVRCH